MTKRWAVFAAALTLWVTTAAWPAQAKTKPKSFVVAVPFDFTAGNRTLPAGSYRFQIVLGSPTQNDTVGISRSSQCRRPILRVRRNQHRRR
jgi:hypothetical protein